MVAWCPKRAAVTAFSLSCGITVRWPARLSVLNAAAAAQCVIMDASRLSGLNAARMLKYDPSDIIVWDFKKELGGNTPEAIKKARLILWKGYCHVHTNFRPEHVVEMRTKYPGIKIVVHPECIPEVVQAADAFGSTTFIVKYIKEQPAGSIIAIGTELNLVSRLADEHPDKKILDLSGQTCPICVNMFRTTLADLAFTLDHLGEVNEIIVEEEIKKDALVALTRMLQYLN